MIAMIFLLLTILFLVVSMTNQIDQLFYKLYDLTAEEIKIIENA